MEPKRNHSLTLARHGSQGRRGVSADSLTPHLNPSFWAPSPANAQGDPWDKHHPSSEGQRVFRILLAEDDLDMRSLLSWSLLMGGFDVVHCSNGNSLLERIQPGCLVPQAKRFDLIITDIFMPGITGLEILNIFGGRKGVPPMILITAFGNEKIQALAERGRAAGIFYKPFDVCALLTKVKQLLYSGEGVTRG